MSDLLTSASSKLGIPEPLVQRSAAARAAANGTSVDDVLAAWAGDGAVAPPPAAAEPAVEAVEEEAAPEATQAPEEPAAEPAPEVEPQPEPAPVAAIVAEEPPTPLEPVPLSLRLRTAGRVGAWSGAALGLIGFVLATVWVAPSATVIGDGPYTPVIQVDPNVVIVGAALISVVFGAVIASLSRAAVSWVNPGMTLSNSPASTAWLGGFIGLILGVIGGAVLTGGFGSPVEGVEGMVQLPVLATIAVMALGGAALGGFTATTTQALGVPAAISDEESEEAEAVRHRLGTALAVPLTGLVILLLLVFPFAYALIQSNHVTAGGAAIVGIITASGILAFASLAGSKPNVRISFGEAMVAVIGIGVVLILILAVLFARGDEEEHSEPETALRIVELS